MGRVLPFDNGYSRSKDKLISNILQWNTTYGHISVTRPVRLTFISSVWTLSAVKRSCQEWWPIRTNGSRKSRESELSVHLAAAADETGCLTKVKEPNLPDYFIHSWRESRWFHAFPKDISVKLCSHLISIFLCHFVWLKKNKSFPPITVSPGTNEEWDDPIYTKQRSMNSSFFGRVLLREVKCQQPQPGFELGSPIPFLNNLSASPEELHVIKLLSLIFWDYFYLKKTFFSLLLLYNVQPINSELRFLMAYSLILPVFYTLDISTWNDLSTRLIFSQRFF